MYIQNMNIKTQVTYGEVCLLYPTMLVRLAPSPWWHSYQRMIFYWIQPNFPSRPEQRFLRS
jgi:hypothetical protein